MIDKITYKLKAHSSTLLADDEENFVAMSSRIYLIATFALLDHDTLNGPNIDSPFEIVTLRLWGRFEFLSL